jgi:hypothetical protein
LKFQFPFALNLPKLWASDSDFISPEQQLRQRERWCTALFWPFGFMWVVRNSSVVHGSTGIWLAEARILATRLAT